MSQINQQLSLFAPDQPQYPFYAPANKKQQRYIDEVFGGAQQIEYILGDVLDMYPYKSLRRLTMCDDHLLTIGASCSQPNWFYMLAIDSGCIHLIHQFSTYPVLDK